MPRQKGVTVTNSPMFAPGTWVVEQVENGTASIEVAGGTSATVPLGILPRGVGEGDVLRVSVSSGAAGTVTITIVADPEEKARRLAKSASQIARAGKGGSGNITL